MEDATNGEGMSYGWWIDVDYGLQTPGFIYPNIFSLKKVKNGTHVHKCQKLTISTAGQQPSIFLNHVWCVFHAFLMLLGTRAWWREKWTRRREAHDRFFRCGRMPSSPQNCRWGRDGSVELTSCCGMLCLKLGRSLRWGWIIWTPIQVTPGVFFKFSMVHATTCARKKVRFPAALSGSWV